VQLKSIATLALALAAGTLASRAAEAQLAVDGQTAEGLLQFFSDSQHITVRSAIGDYTVALQGNASMTLHWNNERVVVPAISAPPGSAEAVDAITTASRPISGNAYSDYVKTRNELEGTFDRGHSEVQYYVSIEKDYLAHQLGANWNKDFHGEQFNLSFGSSYGWDEIKPLADDDTRGGYDHKNTLHLNTVATQVLSPTTLLRLGVEYNVVNGLQHNPYRNVFAGGSHVPERHPEHRERRDLFLKLNQYLTDRSSLKLHYRFYDDDWGVLSHEIESTLNQYLTHGVFASYQYRWYTQGAANFYSPLYTSVLGVNGYLTGDYRMAPLASHLFGVALDFDFGALEVSAPVLKSMGVHCNYERYFNSNNYSANILSSQIQYRF
jgi:hypothetical protein